MNGTRSAVWENAGESPPRVDHDDPTGGAINSFVGDSSERVFNGLSIKFVAMLSM